MKKTYTVAGIGVCLGKNPGCEALSESLITGVSAAGIAQTAAQLEISDPEIRMVFLAESGDTRYEKYSVLRGKGAILCPAAGFHQDILHSPLGIEQITAAVRIQNSFHIAGDLLGWDICKVSHYEVSGKEN